MIILKSDVETATTGRTSSSGKTSSSTTSAVHSTEGSKLTKSSPENLGVIIGVCIGAALLIVTVIIVISYSSFP